MSDPSKVMNREGRSGMFPEYTAHKKHSHYNSKWKKTLFLRILPFILVAAAGASSYGIAQGISSHDVSAIVGGSVGLGITVMIMGSSVYLFLRLKHHHKTGRWEANKLENVPVVSDDVANRIAGEKDAMVRRNRIASLHEHEIEAHIQKAKLELSRAQEEGEVTKKQWRTYMLELLCEADVEGVLCKEKENLFRLPELDITFPERIVIYQAQLKKIEDAKQRALQRNVDPKSYSAVINKSVKNTDLLMRSMHADVAEYRRNQVQRFPDQIEEEYQKLFVSC